MLFYLAADLFKPRKGYQNTHAHFFPNAQQSDCLGRGLRHSSSDMCIPDASELTVTSLEGSVCNLDRADPPPTPPEEKIKMFRSVWWRIRGTIKYATVNFIENVLSSEQEWKV